MSINKKDNNQLASFVTIHHSTLNTHHTPQSIPDIGYESAPHWIMCRWLVYYGPAVLLEDLLCHPQHSLIHQSRAAPFTPHIHPNPSRNHHVNGDGFGIAWYETDFAVRHKAHRHHTRTEIALELSRVPGDTELDRAEAEVLYRQPSEVAVYKSLEPAWNDANLREIASAVLSPLIFAHVRAATVGGVVSRENCHPFKHGSFVFMHNGGVSRFSGAQGVGAILYEMLPPNYRAMIKGNTDSEMAFALFLSLLPKPPLSDTAVASAGTPPLVLHHTLTHIAHSLH
jgi:predicted glutamine amidotransferase